MSDNNFGYFERIGPYYPEFNLVPIPVTRPWWSVMWEELHNAAENFNSDPYRFAPFIRQKVDEIPCGNCKRGSTRFILNYPPERVGNRDQAVYWMCKFHNEASEDAGNPLVNCERDPMGYEYISEHRIRGGWASYGGGGGGGGRKKKRGGRSRQPHQDSGENSF